MILSLFTLAISLFVLTRSAEIFLDGATACAEYWGMSPMLLGLTVVSISTSAPEILVSTSAAIQGHLDIAVGNVIGSNISNITLVLGITALVTPIPINRTLIIHEYSLLLIVTLICGACLANGYLDQINSSILLMILIATLLLMYLRQKKTEGNNTSNNTSHIRPPTLQIRTALLYLSCGLISLLVSSHLLVWSASKIAFLLGISELIIGLTIVALGTSLPELAATIISARRQQHDIAIGNIIGSNLFNLLIALPISGLISPGKLAPSVIMRDYPVMLILTIFLGLLIFPKNIKKITRIFGTILLISYTVYAYLLYGSRIG